MQTDKRTTIHLHRSTKERLEELKPYPSVSFNDLVLQLIDAYENKQEVIDRPNPAREEGYEHKD